jgi:uncharacterized protein
MRIWDWICLTSLVGIWPRWIEPNLLRSLSRSISLPNLPDSLVGTRLLLLTDLHLSPFVSDRYLNKISKRVEKIKPDLILFVGDFICFSKMEAGERLDHFLKTLQAPLGCFASLGNHDYAGYPTCNPSGLYDLSENRGHPMVRLIGKVVKPAQPIKEVRVTDRVFDLPPNPDLIACLRRSGFRLLHNETCQINVDGAKLNITGLGDYWLGRCCPYEAFDNYQSEWPGIILSHNPNTIFKLAGYPGDLVLSGHTHGGQINLPIIANKIADMENSLPRSGWTQVNGKQVVISKGLGAAEPFRLFAPPELILLTLKRAAR